MKAEEIVSAGGDLDLVPMRDLVDIPEMSLDEVTVKIPKGIV